MHCFIAAARSAPETPPGHGHGTVLPRAALIPAIVPASALLCSLHTPRLPLGTCYAQDSGSEYKNFKNDNNANIKAHLMTTAFIHDRCVHAWVHGCHAVNAS